MTRLFRSRRPRPDWWPRLEWPDFAVLGLFLLAVAIEALVLWLFSRGL